MKEQKRSAKRTIIIIYIVTIIILTTIYTIELQELTFKNIILSVLNSILTTLPAVALVLTIFFAMLVGAKKAIKENLSEIDFKNNKEYYRDILKKYTPAELCYIDNFEINLTKSIIATLLNLELKKKIEIKNNQINIINNDTNDLLETETYILNSIKDGKVIIYNPYEMEGSTKKEALDHKLIIKNEKIKTNESKPLINSLAPKALIFFIFIAIICIFNEPVVNFLNNIVLPNINIIAPVVIILIILIIIIKYANVFHFISKIYYLDSKSKTYKRTTLGEEINIKIEGLKNYLTNFSSLDEKEKEELILWEEYLIYSVIFNLNNKIVEELKPLIKIDK